MKIFISWSGENSQKIAKQLAKALKDIFSDNAEFETFISAENIEGGKAWFEAIRKELKVCDRAIICCTPENVNAPWINFEAGASLMNFEREGQVIPYLVGFSATDKKSPLSNLHAIQHSEEGFQNLSRIWISICKVNIIARHWSVWRSIVTGKILNANR